MLIGMERWIVHLGRMDIMFALGCLDRFNATPKERHFDRVLKIFGYLKKYPSQEICTNTKIQKFKNLECYECDWTEKYPFAKEEIPNDKLKAYGPRVKITCYIDNNCAHKTENRR